MKFCIISAFLLQASILAAPTFEVIDTHGISHYIPVSSSRVFGLKLTPKFNKPLKYLDQNCNLQDMDYSTYTSLSNDEKKQMRYGRIVHYSLYRGQKLALVEYETLLNWVKQDKNFEIAMAKMKLGEIKRKKRSTFIFISGAVVSSILLQLGLEYTATVCTNGNCQTTREGPLLEGILPYTFGLMGLTAVAGYVSWTTLHKDEVRARDMIYEKEKLNNAGIHRSYLFQAGSNNPPLYRFALSFQF